MAVELKMDPEEDLPLKKGEDERSDTDSIGQTDTDSSDSSSTSNERPTWNRRAEYLLSLIGYSVAFGNLQRFPYICAQNGGGAFLIPFFTLLLICGMPLYYLEVCLGKFSGTSPLLVWKLCPLFRGIGFLMVIVSGVCSWYYNTLIAWSIYYLGNSFMSVVPWSLCGQWWNTPLCVTDRGANATAGIHSSPNTTNVTLYGNTTENNVTYAKNSSFHDLLSKVAATSPSLEFWKYNVLRISGDIEDTGEGLQWHLVLSLFLAWLLVFLCLIKGVKSLGKVVYVTALLPYILFVAFLIRGLTLPGSANGIIYYLTPDFSRLHHPQVWLQAAIQVFFSLGPAWGGVITMSSYSNFHDNCLKTAFLVSLCEGMTSFMFGFAVFATMGFMAEELGVTVESVATSGPGIVFITYPEAISKLPLPQLWAVLFFIMMITVGLDTEFGMFETLSSGFVDAFPKTLSKRKTLTVGIITAVFFLMGLPFTTRAGMYIYQLIDWYSAAFCLILGALLESLVIGWFYGAERFSRDVELMTGSGVPIPVRFCWCIFCPLTLFIVFICLLATYQAPVYGTYEYPAWSTGLGFFIGLLPGIPVPVLMLKELLTKDGSLKERLSQALEPASDWVPIEAKHVQAYRQRQVPNPASIWDKIKLNLLGPDSIY